MSSYASYSSSMGERKLTIDAFTGIDQSRGTHSGDYGSSPDAVNFITRDGILKTAGGVSTFGDPVEDEAVGRLFQGFFRDSNNQDHTAVVMTLNGKIYGSQITDGSLGSWVLLGSGFRSDDWSAVNYRDETNDWIILTNGVDQAQYWDGFASTVTPLPITQGNEALLFSKITMLNERLWGGVSATNPDRIYWSNSFDPEDWNLNYEDSDNYGGGFVDVATFDGSRIRGIIAAMDDVLIFKDKSLHRLNGSYPGEFSLTQVFGTEGTLASRTIVNDGRSIYFLASDGLVRYSGMTASSLASAGDRRLKDIWSRINISTIHTACAEIVDNIMYLAVPLDGSVINTHIIEYDIRTGTYNLIELPGVDDWLVLRIGQQETLLFVSGGQIYRYDSGYTFYDGEPINAVWTSPNISCGTLSSKKQTGRIYLSVSATSLDITKEPEIKITLISGDKERSKIIKLKTGLNEIRKKVKIRGRMFRFRLENVDGNPLTIHRGIEIHVEEDYD